MIYLGADHGGFEIKEELKKWLSEWGFQFKDLGNTVYDKDDDYPDFAAKVAEKVSRGNGDIGILLCRSGHGIDMVANKFPNVRSAICFSPAHAKQSREHENANILCLTNDYVPHEVVKETARAFLGTKFSFEERHLRRIGKIKEIEKKNFK